MADDEKKEEKEEMEEEMEEEESAKGDESDYLIPGIPDESLGSLNTIQSPIVSKVSKIESYISGVKENLSTRGSSGRESLRGSQARDRSFENGKVRQEALEESSKSEEGIGKTEQIPLNGTKSSLDKLEQVRKPRIGRLQRQCQRRFREIIGKREMKNEELEKQQGNLKQRLNILECSMPAVMVWNIWRMTQGGSVPNLGRVLEKQFQGAASGEVYCPSSPSRHFDCRVREVEAERKQAQKRLEEARTLWHEKMATLEDREKMLEEARKLEKEQKERIEQLAVEARKLREAKSAVEDEGSCQAGECGVIECKKKWLDKVPSNASIKSSDIECLEKLQELAEAELNMKRQIADLERREEDYMRTLQQADELWSKLEGDAASTLSGLQEQLDTKTAANQEMADRICQLEDELEKLRTRMASCRSELEKFLSIGKIETLIGRDDDFADVTDGTTSFGIVTKHETIGRDDDFADVDEKDVSIMREMAEKDTLARPDMHEAGLAIHPDDLIRENQRLMEAADYLARLGSLSALDADDDYICPPDFDCNDLQLTETGLTEEELIAFKENRVTAKELLEKDTARRKEAETTPTPTERAEQRGYGTAPEAIGAQDRVSSIREQDVDVDVDVDVGVGVVETTGTKVEASMERKDAEEFERESRYERMPPKDDSKDETIGEDIVEADAAISFADRVDGLVEQTDRFWDHDKILVSKNDMLTWQNNVFVIRQTITKCPECRIATKDADNLAEMLARYIGTEAKEAAKEVASIEKEVKVEEEMAREEPAEIEAKVAPEDETVTEIEEVEVKVATVVVAEEEEEEVTVTAEQDAELVPAIQVTDEKREEIETPIIPDIDVKSSAETKIDEYPPESATTPSAKVVSEPADRVVVPKVPDRFDRTESPLRLDEEQQEEKETPTEKLEAEIVADTHRPLVPDELELTEAKQVEIIPKEQEVRVERLAMKEDGAKVLPPKEEKEEDQIDVASIELEKEKDAPSEKEEETEADIKTKDQVSVPEVEELKVGVKEMPKKEEIPEKEKVKDEVGVIPEEEISEGKQVQVKVKIIPEAEIPEEEKVKVEVELIPEAEVPEGEKIRVEAERIPEEEEIPEGEKVKVEVELIPEAEVPEGEKIRVEAERIPEEEEISEEEKVKVEVGVIPEAEIPKGEQVEIQVKRIPEEEEILEGEQVEVDTIIVPEEKEEIKVEEILEPEEKEVELEAEALAGAKIDIEGEQIIPEEKEIVVEIKVREEETEETPDEQLEVKIQVLPEEVEEAKLGEEIEQEIDQVLEKEAVEILSKEEPSSPKDREESVVKVPDAIASVEIAASEMEEISLACVCEETPSVPSTTCTMEVQEEQEEEETSLPCVCEDPPSTLPETHPPVQVEDMSSICVCEESLKISRDTHAVESLSQPDQKYTPSPCTCISGTVTTPYPSVEPIAKMEMTQTEITRMEMSKTRMQTITQTVSDIGTQTWTQTQTQTQSLSLSLSLLGERMTRRGHQTKIITGTRRVDPEAEIMEVPTRWKKVSKESSMIRNNSGSQTEKSSFLRILRSLKSSVAYSKYEHEQELGSIRYGKRSEEAEAEGVCDCCMCGKMIPSALPSPKSPSVEYQSSVIRFLSALPTSNKPEPAGIDQAVQHESMCPVCKIKRLQMSLRSQDSSKQQLVVPAIAKKLTRDQQVSVCGHSTRTPPRTTFNQKTDQSCMVNISKIKLERTRRIDLFVETVVAGKDARQRMMVPREQVEQEDKEESKEEGQLEEKASIDCLCSESIETESGLVKRVRCACGDPD
ncbi:titin homolog [Hylaeus anthracinus]|uniref:titin homolog n=1 Tax=Hylaeus anthracinus TaxID=313031 RepID=UPI0023BA091B|nr:titin homolog [Hylaeus anthracinus]